MRIKLNDRGGGGMAQKREIKQEGESHKRREGAGGGKGAITHKMGKNVRFLGGKGRAGEEGLRGRS